MSCNDFFNIYGSDLFEKLSMEFKSEVKKEVNKKNKLINEINSKKFFYIPYCLCLISKFPFFSQMEKCLESIMETLKNTKIEKDELYCNDGTTFSSWLINNFSV